ncbi:MAG TPA: hypothetical protein VF451_07160 [Acidobacteriota bacterium]
MRFGLLILLIALAVLLVVVFHHGRQANPVAEATSRLDTVKGATLEPIMKQVEAAVDAYADENGDYPGDLEMLVPRFLPGVDFLIDPWGTRLRLERGETQNLSLVSAGPDRVFGTGDDIRRSL